MQAAVAHRVLLPLRASSIVLTLEAKLHRPSPVVRPPELCHCHPSSGEPHTTADVVPPTPTARPYPIYSPRADRRRERCRGHPCRRVTPAIPHPNWCLPEYRAHTSHLPNWSTPFLRHLSSRTPASTPTPPLPPRTGSSGEPLLPDVPQMSPPPRCVALATVPNPPRWRQTPKSGWPPLPLLRAPTLPCLLVGHALTPVPWVMPNAVPVGHAGVE
jgi:hypothetical protein